MGRARGMERAPGCRCAAENFRRHARKAQRGPGRGGEKNGGCKIVEIRRGE